MKTDEMNFHKFHLLREFLGSPETIPMRITEICRIYTLLHSATDTLLTVMEYGRNMQWKAVCLLGLQGYFFPSLFPSLALHSHFLPPSCASPYLSIHFMT